MLLPPCPTGLVTGHPLAGFHMRLAALPATHPRRVGLAILQIAMVLALPALCLGMAVMHVCCGVAALGALMALPPVHRLPGFWWAIAFTAWQVVSVATVLILHRHPHPLGGLGMMYTWLALYLAQVAFVDPMVRRWACRGLLVSACLAALLALLQFTIGLGGRPPLHIAAPPLGERFHHSTGFAPVHLTQAFTMAMVALLFLHLPAVDSSAGRARRLAGVLVASGALVLANARLAFLAISAGVAAGHAVRGGRRIAIGLALGAALLAGSAAGQYLLAPGYLTEIVQGKDGRLAIWRTTTRLIVDAPLVGCGGSEAFKTAYAARYQQVPGEKPTDITREAPHAHNSELSIASQHGLPAALFHLAWIFALVVAAWRGRQDSPQSWPLACALVSTFLVAGLFEDLAGHSAPTYVFCISMGLCLARMATSSSASPPR